MHVAAVGSLGFGPLRRAADNRRALREEHVNEAASRCRAGLNHTLGTEWMGCVVDDLLKRQAEGSTVFEVAADELQRLSPGGRPGANTDELMNLLRNYSCEVADGGSQPLRTFEWVFRPSDPCVEDLGAGSEEGGSESRFSYHAGFLPAGNDLRSQLMTEKEAMASCLEEEACAGFTFETAASTSRSAGTKHTVLFKASTEGQSAAPGWHAWHKKHVLDCSPAARLRRAAPVVLTVHVLRESPPVFVVDDFVSDKECEAMLKETLPKMGRSVVGGGGTSSWRQSYSVNMVPDFTNEDHLITGIARRKFAFAREVAGYDVVEGVGQEPVNAVYYKDNGDQYRPHCDGECAGGRYSLGSRVASSLTYCTIADQGGYTLFTRTGLKVVPQKRQMLFFGYFFNGTVAPGVAMDNGHTEHTGCPLRKGRKWIATMWYREGVTADKDWSYWSRFGRSGV